MKLLIKILPILLGFLLDTIIGDPYRMPHPVRLMGSLIGSLDQKIQKRRTKRSGLLIVICVLCATLAAAGGVLWLASVVSVWLRIAVESVLCYYMLAARCLCNESEKVRKFAENGDVEGARKAVSMIVGRDTAVLDEAGILRAAVETVAENTSDGVTAPLFYMALGGGLGACLYKAANTMDSMLGYKNEKHREIGFFPAKLDDVLNYIPSRLTALLMIAASFLCRYDAKNAWRIWRRDRRNHASPNSAQTEAVCAGALGLRLAGDAWYFGELHKKPYIGEDLRPIEPEDIRRANRLMYVTSLLMLALTCVVRGLIGGLL
ncbi:MAG: cobalamin biosynthesis protein CobD [Oscillospiraceae bacterium]|nr:cobalamin biosynthesis protein CobD [Oscillospiraceae bacterium]